MQILQLLYLTEKLITVEHLWRLDHARRDYDQGVEINETRSITTQVT